MIWTSLSFLLLAIFIPSDSLALTNASVNRIVRETCEEQVAEAVEEFPGKNEPKPPEYDDPGFREELYRGLFEDCVNHLSQTPEMKSVRDRSCKEVARNSVDGNPRSKGKYEKLFMVYMSESACELGRLKSKIGKSKPRQALEEFDDFLKENPPREHASALSLVKLATTVSSKLRKSTSKHEALLTLIEKSLDVMDAYDERRAPYRMWSPSSKKEKSEIREIYQISKVSYLKMGTRMEQLMRRLIALFESGNSNFDSLKNRYSSVKRRYGKIKRKLKKFPKLKKRWKKFASRAATS